MITAIVLCYLLIGILTAVVASCTDYNFGHKLQRLMKMSLVVTLWPLLFVYLICYWLYLIVHMLCEVFWTGE